MQYLGRDHHGRVCYVSELWVFEVRVITKIVADTAQLGED
jgi:hypothetical protein